MDRVVDIIVTSKRTANLRLVVEVELGADLDAATDQLKRYMARVGAPHGLVVAGGRVRLLRDTYRSTGVDSIEAVAEFEVESLRNPPASAPTAGVEYEGRVQDWLESLGDSSAVAALPEPIRAVVSEHLVSVIETGDVRAAGPRSSRAAG
jgi:hypothetical protein